MLPALRRPLEGLSYPLLERFAESVKTPFRRAFPGSRVDLAPPPEGSEAQGRSGGQASYDQDKRQLVVPLTLQGRMLGQLTVSQVEPEQVGPALHPFLSALVEAALEQVRLRLALNTDQVTGLANEVALDDALASALARLQPPPTRGRPALDRPEDEPGLSLLALEPRGLAALLDQHGRRFGDQALAELALRLAELIPEALCLARLSGAFLALVPGGAAQAHQAAARLEQGLAGFKLKPPSASQPWTPVLAMGAATAEAAGRDGALAGEAAAIIKVRALRALSRAQSQNPGELLFFSQIVEQAGRVSKIMPLDRVLIDLGRVHGLSEGERFQVLPGESASGPGPVKAEILVVNLGEEESAAELMALSDPTSPIQPGDRLNRLGPEGTSVAEAAQERTVNLAGRQVRVVLDEATGLPCHRSFMALFSAQAAAETPFSLVLLRADGLEGMRESLGRVAVEALMRSLAEIAGRLLPAEALLGRHAPDTLVCLLPGLEAGQAYDLAREACDQLRQQSERTASAGVAQHPLEGFSAVEALDNAAKALVHAGFFGPDTVTAFDAVSLNISGDALFARGRISEAVAEYERALLLDPAEPNVLNSLGVCHGHLGRMDIAIEYFERARAAAPEDFMAYYNLGYALLAQGRPAEARSHLEQALGHNPEHADTLFQLGRLAQGEGRLSEAVELLGRAAKQEGCRTAVHRHLGEALAAVGQSPQAEEAFKRAVKVNPSDASALSSLASLYLDREANQEIALSMARRARELEPQFTRHARVMGRALKDLGRLEESAQILLQTLGQHPEDPFLHVQMGQVERARQNPEAARDHFLRALSLEPNLEEAQAGLQALQAH